MPDEQTTRTIEYSQQIDPSLVKYLVDTEGTIDSIRMILAGKDIDATTDPPKVVDFGEPLVNDIGLGAITAELKTIHRGIMLGTLDKTTPYKDTRLICINFSKKLFDNKEKYGIRSMSDADTIMAMFLEWLKSALSMSVGGGTKAFIKGMARETAGPAQKQKGRLSL